MKIVFALILLVLLSYLVGYFLPQTYEVSRSAVVSASLEEVHQKVSTLSTWQEWSNFKPPTQEGSEITPESRFEGPALGEGAIWIWGGLGDIEPARLQILTSDPKSGITYRLDLDGGRVNTTGVVSYVEVDGGVEVTMSNQGEMATPWSRYFYFLADRSIGSNFALSLEGLQKAFEVTAPQVTEPQDSGPQETEGEKS